MPWVSDPPHPRALYSVPACTLCREVDEKFDNLVNIDLALQLDALGIASLNPTPRVSALIKGDLAGMSVHVSLTVKPASKESLDEF